MLSSKLTTLEGGYSKSNADDRYRKNRDGAHSGTIPIPRKTYRDNKWL
jgi:hypothetical protein